VRFGLALYDGAATCPERVTVCRGVDDYGLVATAYRIVGPRAARRTGTALQHAGSRLSHLSGRPGLA